MTDDDVADVRDCSLQLDDGRTVAWTETGPVDGTPVLRFPGTPACRWAIRGERAPWTERGLRMITTERPGYGRSSRLPGRRFAQPSDDLARVLDHLELERVHAYGSSGAAPHILSFASRYADRVRAATVIAGVAPITDDESARTIPGNQRSRAFVLADDEDGLRAYLESMAADIIADPLAGFRAIMETAPPADQAVINDPQWQRAFVRATTAALEPGVDGWLDESIAITRPWDDIALDAVTTSVTWFHTPHDRNTSMAAAQRIVDALPNARLVVWPEGGHFAAYHREDEILDELLAR